MNRAPNPADFRMYGRYSERFRSCRLCGATPIGPHLCASRRVNGSPIQTKRQGRLVDAPVYVCIPCARNVATHLIQFVVPEAA